MEARDEGGLTLSKRHNLRKTATGPEREKEAKERQTREMSKSIRPGEHH